MYHVRVFIGRLVAWCLLRWKKISLRAYCVLVFKPALHFDVGINAFQVLIAFIPK